MHLSIFIWNTLIIYKLIHHCHKNPSYFSRMNNSEKFVNHMKISKKKKRRAIALKLNTARIRIGNIA